MYYEGQWVRLKKTNKTMKVSRIVSDTELFLEVEFGDWKSSAHICSSNFNTINDIEEWEPKLGERCWAISVHDSFELMRFAGYLNNGAYQFKTIHGGIYNYSKCEPFIGKLPDMILSGNLSSEYE